PAEPSADAQRLAAVSEVLRIISRTPTQLHTVLNEIVVRAAHLCGADHGGIALREGDLLRNYAQFNPEPWAPAQGGTYPLGPGTVARTSVLERRTVHVWGTKGE